MSASIDIFKLKFSVSGHGFDDERNDSGDGTKVIEEFINFDALTACVDETSAYIWLANNTGLKKYDTSDLTEVATSITGKDVYHPNNVANNLGIAFDSGTVTVFDLTDDSVVIQGAVQYAPTGKCDCVIDGDEVHFVSLAQGRTSNGIFKLDLNTLDTSVVYWTNSSSCGFVDIGEIYSYYPPEWNTQNKTLYGRNLSAGIVWSQTAVEGGSAGFPNISQAGFGNEYIWLPCRKYGRWRIGAFPWSGADFITPKPIKVFGSFESQPYLDTAGKLYVCQNTGRTKVAFAFDEGTFRSNYTDVEKVTDEKRIPLAMGDDILVCSYSGKVYIYR